MDALTRSVLTPLSALLVVLALAWWTSPGEFISAPAWFDLRAIDRLASRVPAPLLAAGFGLAALLVAVVLHLWSRKSAPVTRQHRAP